MIEPGRSCASCGGELHTVTVWRTLGVTERTSSVETACENFDCDLCDVDVSDQPS